MAVVLVSVSGGSVVVFLGSLPWVYHEVYLWADCARHADLGAAVGLLRRRTWRLAIIASFGALGTNLVRVTSGWAMSLMLIGLGLWFLTTQRHEQTKTKSVGWTLLAGGTIAIAVGAMINWAKFRHPYMFPLRDQLWTAQNADRRLALAFNGGTLAGPQFFLTSLLNYFRPDGIRLVSYLPFITFPAQPARAYGGAFLDQMYRTGSVPCCSRRSCSCSASGDTSPRSDAALGAGLKALRIPLLGALAATVGVMAYGYIAYRYTADFLPALVLGSAIGVVLLTARLEGRSEHVRRTFLVCGSVLCVFGIVANVAVGLVAARTTWSGGRLVDFLSLQQRISTLTGNPLANHVVIGNSLPDDAPTDTLFIRDDCAALYLATGDQYQPWILVQAQDLGVDVAVDPRGGEPTTLSLFVVAGVHDRSISLDYDGRNRVRLVIDEGFPRAPDAVVRRPFSRVVHGLASCRHGPRSVRGRVGPVRRRGRAGERVAQRRAQRRCHTVLLARDEGRCKPERGSPSSDLRPAARPLQSPGRQCRLSHRLVPSVASIARRSSAPPLGWCRSSPCCGTSGSTRCGAAPRRGPTRTSSTCRRGRCSTGTSTYRPEASASRRSWWAGVITSTSHPFPRCCGCRCCCSPTDSTAASRRRRCCSARSCWRSRSCA